MEIEQELRGLREEVARLAAKVEPPPALPLLLDKPRFARTAGISVRRLEDLIGNRAIATVKVDGDLLIPRLELSKVPQLPQKAKRA